MSKHVYDGMEPSSGAGILRAARNIGLLVEDHKARTADFFGRALAAAWGHDDIPVPEYADEVWNPARPSRLPWLTMHFDSVRAPFTARVSIDRDFEECFIDLFVAGEPVASDLHPGRADIGNPESLGKFIREAFEEAKRESPRQG